MEVRVIAGPLDPWGEVSAYQQTHSELAGQFGATAIFVGTMREQNQGDAISTMTLEHYPGMTEKHLEQVAAEALDRWQILDVLLVHRIGTLQPNDPIVLVAVWSAHRGDAFDACRYVIDELKTRAPLWKQEQTRSGKRWVDKNT